MTALPMHTRYKTSRPERWNKEMDIWRQVVVVDSCWWWTGCLTNHGYGVASWNGKQRPAHRVFYELRKGPIPEGLAIDHLCRNRSCVNPDHLEAVTLRTNVLRGISPAAIAAKLTHCIRGHELSGENISYRNGTQRRCRVCNRERMASVRASIKEITR
jgi:HNH endonuclease